MWSLIDVNRNVNEQGNVCVFKIAVYYNVQVLLFAVLHSKTEQLVRLSSNYFLLKVFNISVLMLKIMHQFCFSFRLKLCAVILKLVHVSQILCRQVAGHEWLFIEALDLDIIVRPFVIYRTEASVYSLANLIVLVSL